VGLRLKTKHRAARPAARLGSITATCARTCTLAAREASIGVFAGRTAKQFPLSATISGRTITLRASAATVKAVRSALRKGGSANAGVVVTGTARDGVVDSASTVWSFS
jgi:hypothetical protein